MPRSDELVDLVKFRLLESRTRELMMLGTLKTPYAFRRRRWLEAQIRQLQFALGQYELALPARAKEEA